MQDIKEKKKTLRQDPLHAHLGYLVTKLSADLWTQLMKMSLKYYIHFGKKQSTLKTMVFFPLKKKIRIHSTALICFSVDPLGYASYITCCKFLFHMHFKNAAEPLLSTFILRSPGLV